MVDEIGLSISILFWFFLGTLCAWLCFGGMDRRGCCAGMCHVFETIFVGRHGLVQQLDTEAYHGIRSCSGMDKGRPNSLRKHCQNDLLSFVATIWSSIH